MTFVLIVIENRVIDLVYFAMYGAPLIVAALGNGHSTR